MRRLGRGEGLGREEESIGAEYCKGRIGRVWEGGKERREQKRGV
jgi:hypothetical protein